MKASEYLVSVPPHLKDFKWDERGKTSLDWQKFKNKFEDVAKKTKNVEQLFERNSSFINGAGPFRMQFEAFETFPHPPRSDAKTSC
jgi:hypothetical protein